MVQLRIGPDDKPIRATYAQHTNGERCEWSDVERKPARTARSPSSTRPAAPTPPTSAPVPTTRRWGSTRELIKTPFGAYGADSPSGPRRHGAWEHPQAFHEAARDARDLGPVAGADLPKPAAPNLEAERDGSQAVVFYSFPPPDPGAAKLKGLLVSLDGSKDGRPPATRVFHVGDHPGRIEFPLELEDRAYTVRAAAVGENGTTSPPTTIELPAQSPAG